MRIESIHFRNFRRFTDLTVQGLPEAARLIVLAGPNGVGKSSFFDGIQTWYRLHAWGTAHGSDVYNAKSGTNETSIWYDRVTVNLHGGPRDQSQLQQSSVYFRTAYRHEVEFDVQQVTQQPSPTENGGHARRAVDADQSVSENYQRLLWQTFSAIYDNSTPDSATKGEIQERLTGRLRNALLRVFPDLTLTRVGGLRPGHSFEFAKGSSRDFPYVNLSAGEKAVFDLLLDAVIKAEFYREAIWCIDEPEVHIGTRAQGLLLKELLALIPAQSQLYLASHSLGLMSEAVKIAQKAPGEVVFLDFGPHNLDGPAVMEPVKPTREFWKRTLVVALDDMASLVAPNKLVLCEGSADGFDAKCYRAIFANAHPDTDFISVGNSHDTQTDKIGLTSALQTIAEGTEVIRVRDRDLASDIEVKEWQSQGVRVLRRRHIESYLYDQEVLDALCDDLGQPEAKPFIAASRATRLTETVNRNKDADDIKAAAGLIYTDVRKKLGILGAGTTARAFAEQYLAPRLRPGLTVYSELHEDIFGSIHS
ncbi:MULTISPECIES: AAA family ATPase [unclassified Rhodococcus (in: high G+C Gram-positive bacteria)]|uniref:AAA family ATPase n=1 Tax=unclassified Rhodococcus (in: high G+C Gram-positive bacteria) TaxID=192944 RepID=UPI0015E8A930|nr:MULTISPECIES: AAA family ATPase [unclassified Rhodococcus (in: high G+C Gram-positive bacteria)]